MPQIRVNNFKTLIGTSEWMYIHEKGLFYPEKFPNNKMLQYYTNHFSSIEKIWRYIVWRYITLKIGLKNGFILSIFTFILTLIPLMFISEQVGGIISAFISFFFLGVGLASSFFFHGSSYFDYC